MTMYYPTYRQAGEENGIDVRALHQSVKICIGLISLLYLQHTNEGHMDGHVYQVFSDKIHAIEELLSSTLEVHRLEEDPWEVS